MVFALNQQGEVFTWGYRRGPTGLSKHASLGELTHSSFDYCTSFHSRRGIDHAQDRRTADDDSDLESDLDSNHSDPSDDSEQSQDEDEAREQHSNHSKSNSKSAHRILSNDDPKSSTNGGKDDTFDDVLQPVRVVALSGEEVVEIVVGRVHAAAKTKFGDVYTWGQNDHGQLGHERVHHLSTEKLRKSKVTYGQDAEEPVIWERTLDEHLRALDVIVGTNHTMVITEDLKLHSFGAVFNTGDHSSLARSLTKFNVTQVSCGALHAGFITDTGQAYTCTWMST